MQFPQSPSFLKPLSQRCDNLTPSQVSISLSLLSSTGVYCCECINMIICSLTKDLHFTLISELILFCFLLSCLSRYLSSVIDNTGTVSVSYLVVPPPKKKIAMLRSATFAFLCKRAIFATERNFRATLAHFGLFLRFSSILETFWGKMEHGTFENPQSFEHPQSFRNL